MKELRENKIRLWFAMWLEKKDLGIKMDLRGKLWPNWK